MNHIFATRLHELRTKAGMSQKELAAELKIVPATFSNYENGIYLPPLDKVCALAKALHCSTDYLCGLSEYNVAGDKLSKQIAPNLTLFQLLRLLMTLETGDLPEVINYAAYLKYKRRKQKYTTEPEIRLVAEEKAGY